MSINITDQTLSKLMEASFKDFHAKGMDYICLRRTETETLKVYFFEGDVSKLPEVVNPHNHRYNFRTRVLAGGFFDRTYTREVGGSVYQAFNYMTPLNGGNGFTFDCEEPLMLTGEVYKHKGRVLHRGYPEIHTIQPASSQTVLLLKQGPDLFSPEHPTRTWVKQGEPKPDTSGLYSKFTEDEFLSRLQIIFGLM